MLRSMTSRALFACICMVPVGIAMGDVSWQAESGNSNLIFDLSTFESYGVVVNADAGETQPGVFRVDLVGPSDLGVDSSQGQITSISGGSLIHAAGLHFKSLKEGSGLSLYSLVLEVPPAHSIESVNITDGASGEVMFRVEAVRATLAEWEMLHTFDAALPLMTAAMCSPLAPVGVAAIVRIERRATTVAVDIRPARPRWQLRRRRAPIASFEVGHLTTV